MPKYCPIYNYSQASILDCNGVGQQYKPDIGQIESCWDASDWWQSQPFGCQCASFFLNEEYSA